jgi:hypothetical protein
MDSKAELNGLGGEPHNGENQGLFRATPVMEFHWTPPAKVASIHSAALPGTPFRTGFFASG